MVRFFRKECAERFRSNRHLRVQSPAAIRVEHAGQ
jgi:hypothetical protein